MIDIINHHPRWTFRCPELAAPGEGVLLIVEPSGPTSLPAAEAFVGLDRARQSAALLAAIFITSGAGCPRTTPPTRPPSPQQASEPAAATRDSPTPEEARRAVVELIRTRPDTFIGSPDPERSAELPLVDRGDGTYGFGVIVVNPGKGWYNATIGQDAPEMYEYSGILSRKGGAWVASDPDVTRFHRHP